LSNIKHRKLKQIPV